MRGFFTFGLLIAYASLIPVIHAAIGEGLKLSPVQWRYDAMIGSFGALLMLLGGLASIMRAWRNR